MITCRFEKEMKLYTSTVERSDVTTDKYQDAPTTCYKYCIFQRSLMGGMKTKKLTSRGRLSATHLPTMFPTLHVPESARGMGGMKDEGSTSRGRLSASLSPGLDVEAAG